MIILISGSSVTLNIATLNGFTVSGSNGATVLINGVTTTVDGTTVFGPYAAATTAVITAVNGDCSYGLTFPESGEVGKTYINNVTGCSYRWDADTAGYVALGWNADRTALVDPVSGDTIIRPVVSYAWANRPAAADNTGVTIRITDVGGSTGSLFISDGAYWKPVGGVVVLSHRTEAVALTGAIAETLLDTVSIPAGMLGTNGRLRVTTSWSAGENNANSKAARIRLGGIAGTQYLSVSLASQLSGRWMQEIFNTGQVDAQKAGAFSSNGSFGLNGNALPTSAVNTSVDETLVLTGQLAVDTDTLSLESVMVELINP